MKAVARSKYALLEHSTQRTCEISASSTVGRENTDIVFPTLSSLSRQHFKILINPDGAWIEDLGSSNGTKLNQVKLEPNQMHPLCHRDSIIAGKVVMTFLIRPSINRTQSDEGLELDDQPLEEPAPMPRPMQDLQIGQIELDGRRLEPDISLVKMQRPRPSKKKLVEADPSAPLNDYLKGSSKRKRKKKLQFFGPQWTTLLLAIALIAVVRDEISAIHHSPYLAPHSARDLTLRYVFSVGLMYLSMVGLQFIFALTIARRWYTALVAIGASVFLGAQLGDRLDHYAEYQKAEMENRLHSVQGNTAKKDKKPSVKSERTVSSDSSN